MERLRDLPGVRDVSLADGVLRLEFEGSMDALVKELARFPVQTLTSEPPELDEIFLSYYGRSHAGLRSLLETLRERRRSLLWWSLGLVALVALNVAFYPSVRDDTALNDYVQGPSRVGYGGSSRAASSTSRARPATSTARSSR